MFFISMNGGSFPLRYKRLRTLRLAMGCVTSTVSRCYLRKEAVPNLGVNINAQSCWSKFCMVCICWRGYVDFFLLYVFSGCKLNFCFVMCTR
jgi:hypothetical protein